jgi:hypothetical protein
LAENADEERFEGVNSLFGHVLLVIVVWDKLVRHMIFLDWGFEFVGALVVQYVPFWSHAGAV